MGVRSTCRAVSRHRRKGSDNDRGSPYAAASQYLVLEFERPRMNNVLAVD
jgi:hypothetical protein